MAQLQVPIDDPLMAKVKSAAQKAGQTLRMFVVEALKQAVSK
jgi:hypothetical protein